MASKGEYVLFREGAAQPQGDRDQAARRSVERSKGETGLPNAPMGDAFPQELAASCLVEGHDVSSGRNGP
jgi:hypothetical protein